MVVLNRWPVAVLKNSSPDFLLSLSAMSLLLFVTQRLDWIQAACLDRRVEAKDDRDRYRDDHWQRDGRRRDHERELEQGGHAKAYQQAQQRADQRARQAQDERLH